MPELIPVPGAESTTDFASEIEDAAISTLQGNTQVGTDGTLAVATIEARYAQHDGGERAYASAELPAIIVWCEESGMTKVGTMLRGMKYTLHLCVLCGGQNIVTARRLNMQIRDAACRAVAQVDGNTTWLSSGYQAWIDEFTGGGPEPSAPEDDPTLFQSVSQVPVTVLWHEEG